MPDTIKGKARKPYEFGVKTAVVVSHRHGLMLGARKRQRTVLGIVIREVQR